MGRKPMVVVAGSLQHLTKALEEAGHAVVSTSSVGQTIEPQRSIPPPPAPPASAQYRLHPVPLRSTFAYVVQVRSLKTMSGRPGPWENVGKPTSRVDAEARLARLERRR